MAIQTILAMPSNGTINISTLATERVSAESRIHGRAFAGQSLGVLNQLTDR